MTFPTKKSYKRSKKGKLTPASLRTKQWRENNWEKYLASCRKYYHENREKRLAIQARFRKKHPEMSPIYRERHYKKYPFRKILHAINSRCNGWSIGGKKYYFDKGIRNFLKEEDVAYLWYRDEARKMKKPSIDRKDSNKDYTVENCQFLEWKVNCGKAGYKHGRYAKTRSE